MSGLMEVCEKLWPGRSSGELHSYGGVALGSRSAVVVWSVSSSFSQVTVVPGGIWISNGWNWKSVILTSSSCATGFGGGAGAAVGPIGPFSLNTQTLSPRG